MKKIIGYLKNHFQILIVLYVVITCLIWSLSTDYDTAPDEFMKYDISNYIYQMDELPNGWDYNIRDDYYCTSYGFFPMTPYIEGAVFMKIASRFGVLPENMFHVVRITSVINVGVFAIFMYLISCELFKEKRYRILFLITASLLPQILYQGSYINNDLFGTMTGSIIVYAWLRGLKDSWSLKSCILLAIGIGLCAVSYYYDYGFILISVFVYCISSFYKKIKFSDFFRRGVIIALISLLFFGWWFVRSYILYDGDIFGLNSDTKSSEYFADEEMKPSQKETANNMGGNIFKMAFDIKYVGELLLSFIGTFGYRDIHMKSPIYLFYTVYFIIGFVAFAYKAISYINKNKIIKEDIKEIKDGDKDRLCFNIAMIFSMLIPWILTIIYSYYSDWQPNGRYILPMVIGVTYFVVKGISYILRAFKNKKLECSLITIMSIIMIVLPIYIYNKYILMINIHYS